MPKEFLEIMKYKFAISEKNSTPREAADQEEPLESVSLEELDRPLMFLGVG
jgi:hypothetical protein